MFILTLLYTRVIAKDKTKNHKNNNRGKKKKDKNRNKWIQMTGGIRDRKGGEFSRQRSSERKEEENGKKGNSRTGSRLMDGHERMGLRGGQHRDTGRGRRRGSLLSGTGDGGGKKTGLGIQAVARDCHRDTAG
jgi:hypothetical protein